MTDLVGVASNAVAAYQRALATVSNNIANVATDGYSRQAVVLQANPVSKTGTIYMGTGVMVDRIQRQYDAFAEANLRNSSSDLSSQEPMVNYANRVVDVMGGQTMGLTSALDQFFTSARELSANPASTVVRGSFVRDAEGLASRFGQLSSQLDLVQEETSQAVESSVGQMNTIIKQLAQVNTQLTTNKTSNAQPAALLDQRDNLLKELAGFTHLNTYFSENGEVLVSLGPSVTQDIVVSGGKATAISANFSAAAPEKVSLVLDPYGTPSPLTSVTSGSLAGLMSFREQVLGSTRSALDNLANTFVNEVNAIHKQGVDGYGEPGGALFNIDLTANSAAGGMSVAFEDAMRVSAAAQFRVIKGANNTGSADAAISFQTVTPAGPPSLTQTLVNNPHPSAGKVVTSSSSLPIAAVTTVLGGMEDVQLFLDGAGAGQQLQLITREGRQLVGQSMDPALQTRLMTADNGFVDGASYSSAYLNQSGAMGYKGLTVFYGAKAEVLQQPTYDSKGVPTGSLPLAASLAGGRIVAGQDTGFAVGTFKLNGIELDELSPTGSGNLQASDIATWINLKTSETGVMATASNDIVVPATQLKLDVTLTLNDVEITMPTLGFGSVQGLANAINEQSAATLVVAAISRDGELVLSNVPESQGSDIRIGALVTTGTTVNALGVTAGLYTGQVSLTRDLVPARLAGPPVESDADFASRWAAAKNDTPIQLGFGTGTPADLARLGFRTGAYINGTVPDDVLVFVTGEGSASVAANYTGAPKDAKQALREQPMELNFELDVDSNKTYYSITITDEKTKTKTTVAKHLFDLLDPQQVNAGISYQGLHLSFTSAPKVGNTFKMDGNVDGKGNNDNMLALAALESKSLVGNKTLGTAYIDHINDMGNIARQASIAMVALTVVHDQAVSARDQVSGVSLDTEAADLIRFQQAYQASAKILQVASQLFDSILQVR
jgi:flagellar hook-associated protein FlgK